jgi:hypothetical protein
LPVRRLDLMQPKKASILTALCRKTAELTFFYNQRIFLDRKRRSANRFWRSTDFSDLERHFSRHHVSSVAGKIGAP